MNEKLYLIQSVKYPFLKLPVNPHNIPCTPQRGELSISFFFFFFFMLTFLCRTALPGYSIGPTNSFMGFLAKLSACIAKRFKAARGGSAGKDDSDDGSNTDGLFFELRALQIATNYFSELNRLGHGGFGPVYKVRFLLLWILLLTPCASDNYQLFLWTYSPNVIIIYVRFWYI